MQNIAKALGCLIVVATIAALFTDIGPLALMLVPTGAVAALALSFIGIPMLIAIDGGWAAIASVAAVLLSVIGLVKQRFYWGQGMAVVGISAVTLLSMLGLGYGG